jgi:hypothetical protein
VDGAGNSSVAVAASVQDLGVSAIKAASKGAAAASSSGAGGIGGNQGKRGSAHDLAALEDMLARIIDSGFDKFWAEVLKAAGGTSGSRTLSDRRQEVLSGVMSYAAAAKEQLLSRTAEGGEGVLPSKVEQQKEAELHVWELSISTLQQQLAEKAETEKALREQVEVSGKVQQALQQEVDAGAEAKCLLELEVTELQAEVQDLRKQVEQAKEQAEKAWEEACKVWLGNRSIWRPRGPPTSSQRAGELTQGILP